MRTQFVAQCLPFALLPFAAVAQKAVPIHALAPPSAAALETIGSLGGLKMLPDGRVLVADASRRRLLVFDASLAAFTVTADSTGGRDASYPQRPSGGLYSYRGDSTLIIDSDSRVFLVIDPAGKIARAMAPVNPTDLINVILQYPGTAGIDAQGRFVYRAGSHFRAPPPQGAPPQPPQKRDTVSIVRANFDSRAIDTIGSFTVPIFSGNSITTDASGKLHGVNRINPVTDAPDDWAVLSDGTVGIVRSHDYHMDWIDPDGTHRSTAPMPFDWRRLTDVEKQAKIDSIKKIVDSLQAAGRPYNRTIRYYADHVDTIIPTIDYVRLEEIADYVPPIRAGAAKPDADGNLWILPSTSLAAKDGLLYDVVNKKGELFERVQLPKDRAIAGFGRGGTVFLMWRDGTKGWLLERTVVVK